MTAKHFSGFFSSDSRKKDSPSLWIYLDIIHTGKQFRAESLYLKKRNEVIYDRGLTLRRDFQSWLISFNTTLKL